MHRKDDDLEDVKTVQELLSSSMYVLNEKKQAAKTMGQMLTDTANSYGINKKALSSARDIAFSKGKGWKNDNPLNLDKDADIKDKTSQLFIKLRDTVAVLQEIGQTEWLTPYISALEGYGIKITVEEKDVDKTAAKEVAEAITSMNNFHQIKVDDEKLLKDKHAPKSDELNFTRPSDYGYVLGLYDKVMNKKNIDDEVQEKFLKMEMLQNAMGLVQDAKPQED